jgi:hypothetical protein
VAEDAAECRIGIAGLCEDVQPGLIEQEPKSRADDGVVVGENDRNLVGIAHATPNDSRPADDLRARTLVATALLGSVAAAWS